METIKPVLVYSTSDKTYDVWLVDGDRYLVKLASETNKLRSEGALKFFKKLIQKVADKRKDTDLALIEYLLNILDPLGDY